LLSDFIKNRKQISENKIGKAFILTLFFVPNITPVCWYNLALFYIPAFCFVLVAYIKTKDRVLLGTLIAFFVLFDLTTPGIIGNRANNVLEQFSVQFIGVIFLLLAYLKAFKSKNT
jgi:hypothetical protein